MKQVLSFRSCVLLALVAAPVSASLAGVLRVKDEDPTTIMGLTLSNVARVKTSLPTYCVSLNGPAPASAQKTLDTQFGSFLFGPLAGGQQQPWPGVQDLIYSQQTGLAVLGDDALSCYVTDSNGVRRRSAGLFTDNFEEPTYDASVTSRVIELPSSNNAYVYKYYVDVIIPVISATQSARIAITDGFDSNYFDAATSYWCQAGNMTLTSCATGTTNNNLWINVTLAPGGAAYNRYIVTRPLKAGVTALPVSSEPITTAAIFLPAGVETRLDNNTSPTYGAISDERPEITTGSLGTTLAGMTEGGNPVAGSFTLSDDTNESAGQLLGAVVTATFNGVDTPVTVDCGSPTPILANPRVSRTCTFQLGLPNVDFATAPGVNAQLSIIAIDARSQQTTVNLPITVASADNDKPVFTVAPIAVPDVSKVPTLACSLADKGSAVCGGALTNFITGIAPGPAGAVDELATQTAAFVPDTANGLRGGNIACVLEGGASPPQLFALSGGPKLATSPTDPTQASLSYALTGTTGSALCTVQVRDAGTFPSGQSAQTETKTFRITISP